MDSVPAVPGVPGREAAAEGLRNQAGARAGPWLWYLFSLQDASYPATDDRMIRPGEVARQIPDIVAEYRSLLQVPPPSWREGVIVVSRHAVLPAPAAGARTREPLCEGVSDLQGEVRAQAWFDRPRGRH